MIGHGGCEGTAFDVTSPNKTRNSGSSNRLGQPVGPSRAFRVPSPPHALSSSIGGDPDAGETAKKEATTRHGVTSEQGVTVEQKSEASPGVSGESGTELSWCVGDSDVGVGVGATQKNTEAFRLGGHFVLHKSDGVGGFCMVGTPPPRPPLQEKQKKRVCMSCFSESAQDAERCAECDDVFSPLSTPGEGGRITTRSSGSSGGGRGNSLSGTVSPCTLDMVQSPATSCVSLRGENFNQDERVTTSGENAYASTYASAARFKEKDVKYAVTEEEQVVVTLGTSVSSEGKRNVLDGAALGSDEMHEARSRANDGGGATGEVAMCRESRGNRNDEGADVLNAPPPLYETPRKARRKVCGSCGNPNLALAKKCKACHAPFDSSSQQPVGSGASSLDGGKGSAGRFSAASGALPVDTPAQDQIEKGDCSDGARGVGVGHNGIQGDFSSSSDSGIARVSASGGCGGWPNDVKGSDNDGPGSSYDLRRRPYIVDISGPRRQGLDLGVGDCGGDGTEGKERQGMSTSALGADSFTNGLRDLLGNGPGCGRGNGRGALREASEVQRVDGRAIKGEEWGLGSSSSHDEEEKRRRKGGKGRDRGGLLGEGDCQEEEGMRDDGRAVTGSDERGSEGR